MLTRLSILLISTIALYPSTGLTQTSSSESQDNYNQVNTYVNPVLPGDHPDPTLLHVGNDFYHCGSSFHFTPYLPIYHSTDLVHWEIISRVLPPANADFVTDKPSVGIWQGAITYFYGSYWIYFSANGQWFSKANTPYGPWTDPVKVATNTATGELGYDNSIFVDDDGKPYMLIKNMQKVNRLQALGKDGQLTDTVMNMDWINASLQYSWAEGPVMCKRNGYYFYFPAGDVSGGQYVLRGTALTADSTKWERLGNFFKPLSDTTTGFKRPNHISAPLQLADGTWWTIGQSYEKYPTDDWSGRGRQTLLFPVTWEDNRPWGMEPTTMPVQKPNLTNAGILWRSVQTDHFDKDTLNLAWHFLNKKNATHYSTNVKKGWIRLLPDTIRTSVLQKETDRYYSTVTKIDFNATDTSNRAGFYLTNGNQSVNARLYLSFDKRKKIIFKLDTVVRVVPNNIGNIVWLKLERQLHELKGYYSADGKKWLSMGLPINAAALDKTQPDYNSWVGTSIGLFTEGRQADFDFFICKDGFSAMPAIGFSNYYGVEKTGNGSVTNDSDSGGWLMLSGVDLGSQTNGAGQVEISAAATTSANVEIWLDDLTTGELLATIPVTPTRSKNSLSAFKKSFKNISGHHDVFIKFPKNNKQQLYINNIRFIKTN